MLFLMSSDSVFEGAMPAFDQDTETLLAGLDLFHKLLYAILLRHIADERNDLAGNVVSVILNDAVEFLLRAADNVNLGSVDGEGLSRH